MYDMKYLLVHHVARIVGVIYPRPRISYLVGCNGVARSIFSHQNRISLVIQESIYQQNICAVVQDPPVCIRKMSYNRKKPAF